MSIREWVIYGLRSGEGKPIRYVGYTTDPDERLRQHVSAGRCGNKDLLVCRWVAALLAKGITPQMVILERGTGDGWQDAERRHIASRKRLLNVSEGGNQPAIPAASRKRAGEKLRTRVFTEEHRRRISDAKRGLKRPDIAERNRTWLAERLRGKKMNLSAEERERRRLSIPNPAKAWREMAPEERQRRSEMAREQMKRVWAERRAAREAQL